MSNETTTEKFNCEPYSMNGATQSQRRSAGRLIREALLWNGEAYLYLHKVIRVSVKFQECGTISFSFEVHRTDCDEFSPRNSACREWYHAFIGKRGKVYAYDKNGSRKNVSVISDAKL